VRNHVPGAQAGSSEVDEGNDMDRRMLFSSCLLVLGASVTYAQAPAAWLADEPKAPAVQTNWTKSPDAPADMPLAGGPAAPVATQPELTFQSIFGSSGPGGYNKDARLWVSGDYMWSWVQNATLPSLVTTSPAGTARANAGVLGAPGTSTLFGGHVDGDSRPGIRLGAGYWLDPEHNAGIEAGFVMVGSQAGLFGAASNGSSILARPYTDAATGLPQAVLIAFPGSSAGSVTMRAESGNFFTGNIDLTEKVCGSDWYDITAMGGYRFFGYQDSVYMAQNIAPTSGNFVPGTQINSADHFSARNEFHGVDLGLRTEFFWNSFGLEVLTKVALGDMRDVVSINGEQTVAVPGTRPVSSVGGVYALQSNIGSTPNNYFGTLPEFGVNLKWQPYPFMQMRLGYSLFLLDGVARAGNQINTNVTTSNFPPATGTGGQPIFNLDRSWFWVQSLNFGVAFTY
jgi:hypothetical protein